MISYSKGGGMITSYENILLYHFIISVM